MIKFFILLIILLFNYKFAISRNAGETEITTEDGIEVFQEDKYYLLKKNVEILSDEFNLTGQLVKIFFEKDLYDVKELIANDSVNFLSEEYNIRGKGEELRFNIKDQKIILSSVQSHYLKNVMRKKNNDKVIIFNKESEWECFLNFSEYFFVLPKGRTKLCFD